MALDAATLALTAKELESQLVDARIDKIFEPTRDEIVLNLRSRTAAYKLLLSARSGSARACLTQEVFENPAVPPSFLFYQGTVVNLQSHMILFGGLD